MEMTTPRRDNHPLAMSARVLAVVCVVAITAASLGPTAMLPKLLYSNNLEHFAAFYLVALVFYTARYRKPMATVARDVAIFASVLEAARLIPAGVRQASFEHWMADLGGILAAAAPLQAAEFRRLFARPSESGRPAPAQEGDS